MTLFTIRQDFRAPSFGPTSQAEIYSEAMAQYRWADEIGFDFAVISEHHGLEDGWMPSPIVAAAAVAGATKRIPIMLSAIIVPLHDPIRLAEQLSVLDHLSEGRVWSVAGAGYRAVEFEMAGVDMKRRGALLESHLRTMIQAWTGEPFEYEGRTVRVTPKPFSDPHPRVLVGGGVEVAARRAARLHLPMMPMNTEPKLQEWYHDEAEKVGYTGGFVMVPQGPTFIHVTNDPEKAWAEIGEYLLYETQTYASFQTPGQWSTPKVDASNVEDLKKSAQIVVGTPEQVIEAARSIPKFGAMTFNPLAGGLPPKLAWESLELFAAEVLPQLRVDG